MDQDRPEYAEAMQAGKRRSSLGALNKSKPVTKLKSMFESKGLGPKAKESGILDKLKPVYASHDASSFGALLGSMGEPTSLQMSVNGSLQQLPATPTAPLFSVLPAPGEPDVLPNRSSPRNVGDVQMNAPVYQESLPGGGDIDVRSAKSPGSAGFLKRMSSSLKKALTPKSSTGKQKPDGFSPSYAGSEASNLSPRPSGQLVITPGSQPSSASMDLNCRSDQTQSAQPRSPSVLMGYEFQSARDYPEWARSSEAISDIPARPTPGNSRPPRSPDVTPRPTIPIPDSAALQHEALPLSTSWDFSPRPQPMASPDQGFPSITRTLSAARHVDAEPQSVCSAEPVETTQECPTHDDHTVGVDRPDAGTDALTEAAGDKDKLSNAVTAVTTAVDFEDGGVAPTTVPANAEAAVGVASDASAPDVLASVPSISAQPAPSTVNDVPMADSLEEIEALWGNDDMFAEPGSATEAPLAPQVASSPVSASKSAGLPQSGRKVAPGVVLQVERESLDLFSLRNSCMARVSDSLMVESLDSFESMGLSAKSRAVGFIPMAPLREGDEDAAMAGRPSGSDGGSGSGSAGPQSPNVTFPVHNSGSPDLQATPGLNGALLAAAAVTGIPSSTKSGTRGCSPGAATIASKGNMLGSATKTATPGGTARANAAPPTALKAMAAANTGGSSASKVGGPKRSLPVAGPLSRQLSTPGQPFAGPSPGSRLPALVATPSVGVTRGPATAHLAKPPVPTATPVAGPGRPGVTPRSSAVFSSGKGQPQASGVSRPGSCAHQLASASQADAVNGLFDTPLILRAAAVPLANTPFSGCDFDLDTVDISAEASKAIAMLGGADGGKAEISIANATGQHATPILAPARGAVIAGTPTMSVLETHVQLLTNKLAEAEASIHQLQDENAMLRDQLSTLQFESSMTNDLDMEREARQFLEQELSVVRHRSDGLEADLRAAHAEVKRREQAAAELLASQQTKEAEWARKEAELELRMQQMASEVEAARNFAQRADAHIAEAESRASAASAKCDEETARSRELQVTLGLQAHQLVQVQRARDDAEAKFQRAMEQLIAAQTTHKKAVVEYEQKLMQSNNLVSQINDVRDKYRQMKQHATTAEQRAQQAEAKAQETAAALAKANMEKAELMQMCNELLTQLEATKMKCGR